MKQMEVTGDKTLFIGWNKPQKLKLVRVYKNDYLSKQGQRWQNMGNKK